MEMVEGGLAGRPGKPLRYGEQLKSAVCLGEHFRSGCTPLQLLL